MAARSSAEQAAAQMLEEILSRVARTVADLELDRRARRQAVQDSLRAVLEHVHAAYLPGDSVPAGLYLHAQWLPGSEPPEPAPDPWLRGALRVVARAAPSQQPADEADDQPQRQGLPSALPTGCSPAKQRPRCFSTLPGRSAWRASPQSLPQLNHQNAADASSYDRARCTTCGACPPPAAGAAARRSRPRARTCCVRGREPRSGGSACAPKRHGWARGGAQQARAAGGAARPQPWPCERRGLARGSDPGASAERRPCPAARKAGRPTGCR